MAELGLDLVPLACPRRALAGGVKVGAGAEARAGPGPGRTELRAQSPGPAHSPEKSSWRNPPRGPRRNAVRGQAGHRQVWHGLMSHHREPGTIDNQKPQASAVTFRILL